MRSLFFYSYEDEFSVLQKSDFLYLTFRVQYKSYKCLANIKNLSLYHEKHSKGGTGKKERLLNLREQFLNKKK